MEMRKAGVIALVGRIWGGGGGGRGYGFFSKICMKLFLAAKGLEVRGHRCKITTT